MCEGQAKQSVLCRGTTVCLLAASSARVQPCNSSANAGGQGPQVGASQAELGTWSATLVSQGRLC